MTEGVTIEFYFDKADNSTLETITSKFTEPYEQAREDYNVRIQNKIEWGRYFAPSSMIIIGINGEQPELEKAVEYFLKIYGWKPWGATICKPNSIFECNDTERGIETAKNVATKMGLNIQKINWLNEVSERPWGRYCLYKKKDRKWLSTLKNKLRMKTK